jgi:hypothetical protein
MEQVEQWLGGRHKDIRAFIDEQVGRDLHAKRVASLAGATLGVMTSASLAVATIGQAPRLRGGRLWRRRAVW